MEIFQKQFVYFLLRYRFLSGVLTTGVCFSLSMTTYAFESAKVLPKGVRNVTIRTVETKVETKTNSTGVTEPLAEPLNKDLTFDKVIRGEKGVRKNLARGGMNYLGLTESDSIGTYNADLRGNIRVVAPIIAYGLTEKLTLAVAAPWYQAATNVDVGFQPNGLAQDFVNRLSGDPNYQLNAGHISGGKLNNAVGELQKKLADNGYNYLGSWRQSGWGDTTLAAKYLVVNFDAFQSATTFGVVAPTGRVDNPDILTDIPFGDGSWDSFAQATFDFPLPYGFFINHFDKYTYQFKSRRSIRIVTEDEPIEGDTKKVGLKMGDFYNAGLSLQYEPDFGLVAGLGSEYFRKFGDRYDTEDPLVADKYQENSAQSSWRNIAKLGYSTVPAFKAKRFPLPFIISAAYSQHKQSVSLPTNDLLTVDVNLFF